MAGIRDDSQTPDLLTLLKVWNTAIPLTNVLSAPLTDMASQFPILLVRPDDNPVVVGGNFDII